jgi:NTE family protein
MSTTTGQLNVTELLAASGVFSALDKDMIQAVAQELQPMRLMGGETLFREGDSGESLFLLVHGRLAVSVNKQLVGEVGRGQVVGEMSVLTGEPRSATVRAERDSLLVRFSKEAFERIVEKDPRVMTLISRRLIARLREASKGTFRARVVTIALLPVHASVPIADIAKNFTQSLSEFGKCGNITSKWFDDISKGDEAFNASAPLQELENQFQFVIYQADPARPNWTRLCLRQADRILIIARGDQQPDSATLGNVVDELRMVRKTAPSELVLVHPESNARPERTQQWVKALNVETFHHVKAGSATGYNRLARILTGRAIGLVLGGGGARGFAHIGVIRAFADLGIPIDFIGGTSMGSVISAQHAAGWDFKTMIEINRKGWIDMDPMRDKTLPVMALLSCRKLDHMLDMMFDDLQIEDLWIKYFCVSANLTQASEMVHQVGSLKRWVRASMAIPGVALPVFDKGDLLIDGGVLNNLPGDIMRQISGGTVIVVDVSPQKDLSVDPAIQRAPSSWKIIASRMPLREKIHVPNLLDIMMRTVMLSSTQNSQEVAKGVDLYLRPPIDQFTLFEWKSLEKLATAGYEFARIKLQEWWQQRLPSNIN